MLSPVHISNNVEATSNIVEATFDFVEATFDPVATNGNNVKRVSYNFVLSTKSNVASTLLPFLATIPATKSKQIEHVQFVSTLSKGRSFTINSFYIVAKNGKTFGS